jgi:alpha-glucosidase (family GH31 glycosyl hydrolase)
MYGAQSWVFDPDRFPEKQIRAFVDELHNDGARYVVIVDHNIKIDNTYFPYTTGMQNNVFIWNPERTAYLPGVLWADYVSYFPDFTSINTTYWWANNVKVMHEKVPIDGLWIDMNEPTITCTGQCGTPPHSKRELAAGQQYSPHNPPWTPSTVSNVNEGTFNMSAIMNYGILYNLHNMFGYFQARASHLAMEAVRGQRGFVLSRSTFPGSGRYAAHWLGDNWSNWHDLSASIPGVLSFSFFGIPMVGPDICGFLGNATSELCTRWMQIGAFFPFCRNHNASPLGQEPFAFGPENEKIMINAMMTRYTLLPYYYTLFYVASQKVHFYA